MRIDESNDAASSTFGVYIPTALLDKTSFIRVQGHSFYGTCGALSLRYPDYVISGSVAAYLGYLLRVSLHWATHAVCHRECPTLVRFPEVVIDDSIRIPPVRAALPSNMVSVSRHASCCWTALAYSTKSTVSHRLRRAGPRVPV